LRASRRAPPPPPPQTPSSNAETAKPSRIRFAPGPPRRLPVTDGPLGAGPRRPFDVGTPGVASAPDSAREKITCSNRGRLRHRGRLASATESTPRQPPVEIGARSLNDVAVHSRQRSLHFAVPGKARAVEHAGRRNQPHPGIGTAAVPARGTPERGRGAPSRPPGINSLLAGNTRRGGGWRPRSGRQTSTRGHVGIGRSVRVGGSTRRTPCRVSALALACLETRTPSVSIRGFGVAPPRRMVAPWFGPPPTGLPTRGDLRVTRRKPGLNRDAPRRNCRE